MRIAHHQLTDRTFGHWRVIGPSTRRRHAWLCRCDCGTVKDVQTNHLTSGKTLSCGCRRSEICRKKATTHGLTYAPLSGYKSWQHMRSRCQNHRHIEFHNYGARDVKVCARWEDFAKFHEDMGDRPSRAHSIGRIDNNGHYEPGNCRWETAKQQAHNTRVNRLLEWQGEMLPMTEAARRVGLKVPTLLHRLEAGWSVDRALTAPLGPTSRRVWRTS